MTGYTGPIPLEAGHTYEITATGTDKLGNSSEKTFTVTTPADAMSADGTIRFDDVTHVYTRAAHYYVINSGKGDPWDVPRDIFEFIKEAPR